MYYILIDEFCLWSERLRLHDIRFLEAVDGAGVDAPVLPVVEDVDARHLAPLWARTHRHTLPVVVLRWADRYERRNTNYSVCFRYLKRSDILL